MPNTITKIITLFKGKEIGQDQLGNKYFQDKKNQTLNGRPRRWVVYKHRDQAADIPPLCHAWLHHTTDRFPTLAEQKIQTTPKPYNPKGSIADLESPIQRLKALGDYQAWQP